MATLLLDSHTLLWFLWDDPKLSAAAKTLIEDPDHRKLVSVASCWEIAIKAGLGRLQLGEPARQFLARELAANGFELMLVSLDDATAVESLPRHHGDPFDRMLVVQARSLGAVLVSSDVAFDAYGIPRQW